MYGPYEGEPDEVLELTAEQKRALRRDLDAVAARTRSYLPDEYVIGSELTRGMQGGIEAAIAVQPPVGRAVSASVTPDTEDGRLSETQRRELARGLTATVVHQVKQAVHDDMTPAAR